MRFAEGIDSAVGVGRTSAYLFCGGDYVTCAWDGLLLGNVTSLGEAPLRCSLQRITTAWVGVHGSVTLVDTSHGVLQFSKFDWDMCKARRAPRRVLLRFRCA